MKKKMFPIITTLMLGAMASIMPVSATEITVSENNVEVAEEQEISITMSDFTFTRTSHGLNDTVNFTFQASSTAEIKSITVQISDYNTAHTPFSKTFYGTCDNVTKKCSVAFDIGNDNRDYKITSILATVDAGGVDQNLWLYNKPLNIGTDLYSQLDEIWMEFLGYDGITYLDDMQGDITSFTMTHNRDYVAPNGEIEFFITATSNRPIEKISVWYIMHSDDGDFAASEWCYYNSAYNSYYGRIDVEPWYNDKDIYLETTDVYIYNQDIYTPIHAYRPGNADNQGKNWMFNNNNCTITNNASGVAKYTTRLYNVCLGRRPDEAGKNYWINMLASGEKSGAEVAYGFIFSDEFKQKNYCNEDYVKQLYRAFMGREYDQGGFEYWVNHLENGMTREQVFNGFSQSDEFRNLCDSYGIVLGDAISVPEYGTVPTGKCLACGQESGVRQFVDRLYNVCLDREPDLGGSDYWCERLWNHTNSGRQTAFGFVFSDEFKQHNYSDADYVEHLYAAFFGRPSDEGGKKYWLDKIANGMTREEVFDGFAGSDEFSKLCAKYGIKRG